MTHHHFLLKTLFCLFVLFSFNSTHAQITPRDWQLNPSNARNQKQLEGIPKTALYAAISIQHFKQTLKATKQIIQLPNPEGQFEKFIIEPSNVVAPEVTHLYTIQTFKGHKADDPTTLIAGDISDNGFHAGVFTADNSYFIEPVNPKSGSVDQLAIYYNKDADGKKMKCHAKHSINRQADVLTSAKRSRAVAKRTFRLAVVATGEYGQQFGGTPYSATAALNAMASGVNMMNVIYLRDVGIEFTLVSNADMVFGDPNTDNIDVNNEDDIFEKTPSIIENSIGVGGYDVGHMVIWANLGGAASPGICNDFDKAGGYSGAEGSVKTLWIDYVAHEIGHQFNADHNFVSTECETSVNGSRYEPGEGSSIMSYADVCGGAAQYATGSDPYFHYASAKTILDYVQTLNCGTTTASGNTSDPVPNAQSDITIPK